MDKGQVKAKAHTQESMKGVFSELHLQVRMVGIRAPNMRNSTLKKRKPALLKALLASLPMSR